MQTPIEVTFEHCESSPEIWAEIAKQAKRLEKFGPLVTSCRVAIGRPNARRRSGDLFAVHLHIALPERKDVVVDRTHGDAPEREHALVAIREAFDAAVRQVEEAAREMRGPIKTRLAQAHGRVTKFLAGEDCGFIETAEGREVYFHRDAVLDGAFDRLRVGAEVWFVEEQGAKGPQATTVRLVDKRRPA